MDLFATGGCHPRREAKVILYGGDPSMITVPGLGSNQSRFLMVTGLWKIGINEIFKTSDVFAHIKKSFRI